VKFEDVEIKISLSSDWWRDPPRCEIYVDDTVVDRLHVSSKRINCEKRDILFRGNLTEGSHRLNIRYLNKKDDDDQFDENGVGLYFQNLYIENITINGIKFNLLQGRKCCRLKIGRQVQPYSGDTLTVNCDWYLNFSVPTYLWLMENT